MVEVMGDVAGTAQDPSTLSMTSGMGTNRRTAEEQPTTLGKLQIF